MKTLTLFLSLALMQLTVNAQNTLDKILPVRGFSIGAPTKDSVETFVKFIDEVLGPRHINALLLRIDYNYDYKSHPELRGDNPLTKADMKKIVRVCKKHNIRIIPQINMLGHQSWAGNLEKLLEVYPEFDETPWVKMPKNYKWPNPDGLYCKSYCPLHPGVHKIVFDVIDEIVDVCETDAFHAGMDEVFYIGEAKCPRCGGRDKAELFAGEVTRIHDHLKQNGKELWIWGDRLLDGKTTGIGMWEASMNTTYRAIDLIPKDVVICDWHYERADPTAAYFALKGFHVITCPWNRPEVAVKQLRQMIELRENATPETKERFYGMMQTIWTNADNFIGIYSGPQDGSDNNTKSAKCFTTLFKEINTLNRQ